MKVPGTFLGFWCLALFCGAVFAQSQLAQNIPVKTNPRFLPNFLERFSDGFRAQTRFAQPEMPEKLREFWKENMSEPRDFAEEVLPGVKWPRFQWGIQASGAGIASATRPGTSSVVPIYQWIDVKNPERLAREWNKAFCFEKEKSWIGVAWTGDRSIFEFFVRESGKIKVRRYVNEKFVGEFSPHEQNNVARIAPQMKNPQAAHLQFNIQREFLIFPRTFARTENGEWERVYFP